MTTFFIMNDYIVLDFCLSYVLMCYTLLPNSRHHNSVLSYEFTLIKHSHTDKQKTKHVFIEAFLYFDVWSPFPVCDTLLYSLCIKSYIIKLHNHTHSLVTDWLTYTIVYAHPGIVNPLNVQYIQLTLLISSF